MKILSQRSLLSTLLRAVSKTRKNLCLSTVATISALSFSQLSTAAICQYEIKDEWASGFRAEVTVTNDSDEAINGWNIQWEWSDGSSLQNSWNANFDCSNSMCTITALSWSPVIPANDEIIFGLVGTKGTNGAVAVVPSLGGNICGGGINTPLVTPTPTVTPTVTPTPTNGDILWSLDGETSSVQYISLKRENTAELNSFEAGAGEPAALQGSIDQEGRAILAIDLNDVATNIDIRNERLRNILFETNLLPTAYIEVDVNTESVAAMAAGTTATTTLEGSLSIHGVRQGISSEVLIVKTSSTQLSVRSLKPILVDSKNFDMDSGIEALRVVANLSSISETVPVYLHLNYQANTDDNATGVAMAAVPSAPTSLIAAYNADASEARLSWNDNSSNETGFIIRRKSPDGRWATTDNATSGTNNFSEGLPDAGEFDYKVIAINNSVPSEPSNVARVTVTEGSPEARGKEIFGDQCASCHGTNAEGTGNFPALNTPRDINVMIEVITQSMPLNNAGACDEQCAQDVAAFLQTLWVTDLACDRSIAPITYGARQLKILTKSEYQNTVEDLLGVNFDAAEKLSADDKVGLFFNKTHASVVASSYSNYLIVAEEIAQWSADRNFSPALNCSNVNQDCANTFINDFAQKLFRRPLTQDERELYSEMANGDLTSGDIKLGIQMAMEGMLSSPQFLYRHELGEPNPNNGNIASDAFELTSYEMATFLSYTFAGTSPDDTLLAAAANNELRSDSAILAQAQRLSSNAKGVMGDFLGSWLGIANLDTVVKDEIYWGGFEELAPDMEAEAKETFASIMLDANESFGSLYNANYSYLNQSLAEHYGVAGVSGNELRKVTTPGRGGILANGAFMARWGEAVETAPVIRSVRVRRRMLCQDQPPPPAGTFEAREKKLAELSELLQDPTTTNRLKYHRLTEDAPCTSCHTKYINPLGFGMEDFDTVGRLRTTDLNGNIVNALGELYAPNDYSNLDEVEAFDGSMGLGQVIANLPSAQACLPKQMFRYFIGVGHDEIDPDNPQGAELNETEKVGYACAVEELKDTMMNDSPRSMLEAFGILDAVRYRKAWSRN